MSSLGQNIQRRRSTYIEGMYAGIILYLQFENPDLTRQDIAEQLRDFNKKQQEPDENIEYWINILIFGLTED